MVTAKTGGRRSSVAGGAKHAAANTIGERPTGCPVLVSRSSWMAANVVGAKILQKMWEGPYREEVWPFLDPWYVVGLRTTASVWNILVTYGPHGEHFFFLIDQEPFVSTKAVEFRLCVTPETLKGCAKIGLHMIAEEAASSCLNDISP